MASLAIGLHDCGRVRRNARNVEFEDLDTHFALERLCYRSTSVLSFVYLYVDRRRDDTLELLQELQREVVEGMSVSDVEWRALRHAVEFLETGKE